MIFAADAHEGSSSKFGAGECPQWVQSRSSGAVRRNSVVILVCSLLASANHLV